MAQIILTDSYYTFDASLKTITLAAPYGGLSLGQIVAIIDLETNDILYNSMTQRTDAISISDAVVTHTHGNTGQSDTDELQIIIDDDVRNRNAASESTSVDTVVKYMQLVDPFGNPHILHDGHLKVLGYHEAIGHNVTNGDLVVERASGRKTAIGTGSYTLLERFDFVQPAGDTQMYLQSTSAEDAVGGTGVEQITIEYFDAGWLDKKTVQVVPTGVSQVTLTVSDIYRIHKMYYNKGGVAAGNITLTNEAGDVLYGEIAQYAGFMERCIFYVGNGKKVTCTEGLFTATTGGGILGRLFVSEEDAEGNVVPRGRIPFEIADDTMPYVFGISETASNPNNKRIAIGLAVSGNLANQKATGTLKGFEETI